MLDEKAPVRKNPTRIQYRRLRAPQEDNATLQNPRLKDAPGYLEHNLLTVAESGEIQIGDLRLRDLSRLGRSEVVELAKQHTGQYFDVSQIVADDIELDRIVMSGHQPKLFHPGVWFKNFSLSKLGTDLNCVPINLIVDNDICGVASIQVPNIQDQSATLTPLPFDAPGDNIPFEARKIEDRDFFNSFASRVQESMKGMVDEPLVTQLWGARDQLSEESGLGAALARFRHKMELHFGLKTLEVPLSQVAQTSAFAHFAKHLLERSNEFRNIYNRSLLEYRQLHKIRSHSHPVPPLDVDGEWTESPFWIWKVDDPVRARLFTRQNIETFELTDRRDVHLRIENNRFVEQFTQLTSDGIAIRPRALANTMFCRLVLSDLFLHGIGGAKYDQLNDAIIEHFFDLAPPGFITLTATKKLPIQHDQVTQADITRIDRMLRELRFHPENQDFESDSESSDVIQRKREWISRELPKRERLERHRAIEECNHLLQQYVEPERQNLLKQRNDLAGKVRNSQILGSREYSFCLFPIELIEQLKLMAS